MVYMNVFLLWFKFDVCTLDSKCGIYVKKIKVNKNDIKMLSECLTLVAKPGNR